MFTFISTTFFLYSPYNHAGVKNHNCLPASCPLQFVEFDSTVPGSPGVSESETIARGVFPKAAALGVEAAACTNCTDSIDAVVAPSVSAVSIFPTLQQLDTSGQQHAFSEDPLE
jgi:hypothetical protein